MASYNAGRKCWVLDSYGALVLVQSAEVKMGVDKHADVSMLVLHGDGQGGLVVLKLWTLERLHIVLGPWQMWQHHTGMLCEWVHFYCR